ncbi:nucleoside phosphorylase-like protein [Fischerella sp. NIES-4106]|nr:nucleoside phosphorylase-like protein [Fischerella sp. NIES-4106]
MESTALEELLTNIQKLQSIMIEVATNPQEHRIQDHEEEYIELYVEIGSQIEDLQYEGLLIENPNNFQSLWDWYNYWKSKLSKLAWRGEYIHNLYQNVCNQIDIALFKQHVKVTSPELLDKEIEPTQIEELKTKIEKLQEIMIEVATEVNAISSIQYNDENYRNLYQEVNFKIGILREKAISVSNPNQFRSLWQWYSFYSEQLESTKNARREYVNKLYINFTKPIEKALKQYSSKSSSSTQEFIQDLKHRFNQLNSSVPITSSMPTASLSNSIQTSTENVDDSRQYQTSEPVSKTFSIAPNQVVDNSFFANTNSTLTWTDYVMNPELFLEQDDIIPLESALEKLFAINLDNANIRRSVFNTSGVDSSFITKINLNTSPVELTSIVVAQFRDYKVTNRRLDYHPMVSFLQYFMKRQESYDLADQDVELFDRLVEKGQENFKALAARNTVGRIESPIGNAIGTGVLIKNNLLLTCNHIFSKTQVKKAWVRFGYKIGSYESAKDIFELDLITSHNRLDFSILKINGQVSQKVISVNETALLDSGQEIRIIHHPHGNPVVISDLGQILKVGEDYIDHNLKTDDGSSGAPIFNRQWELIAIHQGNVGISRNIEPGSTGGIPIRAIWNQISSYLC